MKLASRTKAKAVGGHRVFNFLAVDTPHRDWSLVDGFCFRNLIVGHTNTLNYYQAMNDTGTPAARVSTMGWLT